MNRLKTVLKWSVLFILALLVLLIAAWLVSRIMYPDEAQRKALARMGQPLGYAGDNAFPLLWTIERDVPAGKMNSVMASDAQQLARLPLFPDAGDEQAWQFESAASDYPDLSPSAADRGLFCTAGNESCLDRVRSDPEAYTALIDRHEKLLDRIERLHEFDYVQSDFPYRPVAPIPAYQSVFHPGTRHAVRFVQGQTRQALAATCRDIATWRRLGANTDRLITRMIGIANATDHSGQMLASMLAEIPADQPLPQPCHQALAAPEVDELSLCSALHGEFDLNVTTMRRLPESAANDGPFEALAWAAFYDAETTLGMIAQGLEPMCSQAERDRLRADLPPPADAAPVTSRFACLGNPIGCMLDSISAPAFAGYRQRLLDYGAKLRVLGTLAWMRRHAGDGRSPAELLAARPEDLTSPQREIEFGPDGKTLRVALYETRRGEYWTIPLPPELHAGPARPQAHQPEGV